MKLKKINRLIPLFLIFSFMSCGAKECKLTCLKIAIGDGTTFPISTPKSDTIKLDTTKILEKIKQSK